MQGHSQERQLPEWKKEGFFTDSFTDQLWTSYCGCKGRICNPSIPLEFLKPK